MRILPLIVALLLMALPCAAEEPVEIPLDQIWALNMPGTRDVEDLNKSLTSETQLEIGYPTQDNQQTKPAFAVLGTGEEALRAAHAFFMGKIKPSNPRRIFPKNSEISVVFFSSESGFHVHIDRVERQGTVVNIYYRFVASESASSVRPRQFAIIPLGILQLGKHRVNVIESSPKEIFDRTEPPLSHSDTLRIVGNSFSFFVGEQTTASQESSVIGGEIYLDEIWAYAMPGTRDIRKLQAENLPIRADGHLIAQIRRSLSKTPPKEEKAKAGFAVRGAGIEALHQAHKIIVKGKASRREFSVGEDISVAFFSYRYGSYVHLLKVDRQKNDIGIRYRFAPHETMEVTTHFALIPLGKLSIGTYHISIMRSPMEQRLIDRGFRDIGDEDARRITCGPFSFSIVGKGEEL